MLRAMLFTVPSHFLSTFVPLCWPNTFGAKLHWDSAGHEQVELGMVELVRQTADRERTSEERMLFLLSENRRCSPAGRCERWWAIG